MIGLGKANIIWPGLSAPIIRGKELVEQHQLPEDPEREKKLVQLRDQMGIVKRQKLSPIERGWSGSKMPGRSIGGPDPIGEGSYLLYLVVLRNNYFWEMFETFSILIFFSNNCKKELKQHKN